MCSYTVLPHTSCTDFDFGKILLSAQTSLFSFERGHNNTYLAGLARISINGKYKCNCTCKNIWHTVLLKSLNFFQNSDLSSFIYSNTYQLCSVLGIPDEKMTRTQSRMSLFYHWVVQIQSSVCLQYLKSKPDTHSFF